MHPRGEALYRAALIAYAEHLKDQDALFGPEAALLPSPEGLPLASGTLEYLRQVYGPVPKID